MEVCPCRPSEAGLISQPQGHCHRWWEKRSTSTRKPAGHLLTWPLLSLFRPSLEPCSPQRGHPSDQRRAEQSCCCLFMNVPTLCQVCVPGCTTVPQLRLNGTVKSLLEEIPGRGEQVSHWPTVSGRHSSRTSSGQNFSLSIWSQYHFLFALRCH